MGTGPTGVAPLARFRAEISGWPAGRWVVAVLAAVVAGLAMGIPTGIVQTPFYHRMTPVTWWDYPIWAASAALLGLIAATYVGAGRARSMTAGREGGGRTVGATLLSVFAVGCPICNKLVVAVIGVSGALNYFGPVQPLLGVLGLGLLVAGFALRLRGATSCPVSQGPGVPLQRAG